MDPGAESYCQSKEAISAQCSECADVDGDRHRVTAAADEDALNRADVAVVSTIRHGDVILSRQDVVGGIEVDPNRVASED